MPDGTAAGGTDNQSSQAFSLHLLPEAWEGGIFVLLPDFSLTYNVSRPDATLVLKAGPSFPVAFGEGFAATVGLQAGAAVIGRIGPRTGLLIDVTPRFFFGGDGGGALVTIGIGLVVLPR